MNRLVTAAFHRQDQADRAVAALVEAGFERDTIEVTPDPRDPVEPAPVTRVTGADLGAVIAAAVGGVVGVIVAALMVTGAIPDLSLGLRGAPMLGAVIRGGVVGVVSGALFGFILGMGIWASDGEPDLRSPAGGFEVRVEVTDEDRTAREVFERVLPGSSML